MRQIIFPVGLIILLLSSAPEISQAQGEEPTCPGRYQLEITACEAKDTQQVLKELKALTSKIEDELRADPEKLERFRTAQRAWEDYVRAQLRVTTLQGTATSMCLSMLERRLFRARLDLLESRYNDKGAGDACGFINRPEVRIRENDNE